MSAEELRGYEKEKAVLDKDPYTYVLGKTEIESLRALNRYQIEQGLMNGELDVHSRNPALKEQSKPLKRSKVATLKSVIHETDHEQRALRLDLFEQPATTFND